MIGLDSDIIISILRKMGDYKSLLKKLSSEEICTSEIVIYEILYGLYASRDFSERRIKEFEAIMDTFSYIFPIDRKASENAAKIGGKLSRQGKIVGHSDILIAGSLLANGCNIFATNNIKHFENIKELELIK